MERFVRICLLTLLLEVPCLAWPSGPGAPTPCTSLSLRDSICEANITEGPVHSFTSRAVLFPGSEATYIDVGLWVEAPITPDGTVCPGCQAVGSRLTATLGLGSTYTSLGAKSGVADVVQGSGIASSLTCFPGAVDDVVFDNVSISVLTNTPIWVKMAIASAVHVSGLSKHATFGGTRHGNSVLFIFNIEDEDALYERVSLRLPPKPLLDIDGSMLPAPGNIHAYVLSENNSCIRPRIDRGSCANPEEIIACLKLVDLDFAGQVDTNRVAQHFTFNSDIVTTLGRASNPPRSVGRWFILLHCERKDGRCAETTVTIENTPEHDVSSKIVQGIAFMTFVPMVLLAIVDLLYFGAYKLLMRMDGASTATRKLWPALIGIPDRYILRSLKEQLACMAKPMPFLPALLALMVGSFLATAGQFVLTHWWLMERTGNRDVCFYNEKCYYTVYGVSVPINHMLSHIPYFVAGFHVLYQTISADSRITSYREDFPEKKVAYELDLRPFYAVAGSFIAEGFGSALYHVCPSVETFQFDTCFMIPIAHICSCALLDWQLGPSSHITALKYFLYIIAPIWMINFVGTWYDIGLMSMAGGYRVLYWMFAIFTSLWAVGASFAIDVFFSANEAATQARAENLYVDRTFTEEEKAEMARQLSIQNRGWWVALCTKAIVIFGMVAAVASSDVRMALGGMANTCLLLSIVVMIIVVLWQMANLSFRSHRFGSAGFARALIKYAYVVAFFPLIIVAMWCFQEKVVLVMPGVTPATSNAANSECVVSIFDLHDVWHLLSAIGLAMFAMMLLDVKVHTFARINRLDVLTELDAGLMDALDETTAEDDEE